jgi:SAM-dependent methyltransferase
MTQNIYDDPGFFDGYSRLQRSIDGLDGAAEWPAMRALVPPLAGARVADLGCGFGWFCMWAHAQGARFVLGVDVSEKMLARAAAKKPSESVRYERQDLETFRLAADAFDLVYSSLAFHYIVDLGGLLASIHRALVPDGWLVFSAEHPIYTAPSRPGWVVDAAGRRTWPVDGYSLEGPRVTDWLAPGVVKQHRTIGTYVSLLLRAGFTLRHLEEWAPSEAQLAHTPNLAEERERPIFLLVAAQK